MYIKDLSLNVYNYLHAFISAVGEVMSYCKGEPSLQPLRFINDLKTLTIKV
jgi:hypothetical protein